jgi:hypothetical protein
MAGQIPLKQQAPRASSSATQLRSFRFRPPILPRWPADHGTYRYTHHRTFAQTCCSCRRTRTRTYAHIHKGMQSHTCVTIGYTCSCHYATTFSYAHSNKTATLRHSSRGPARPVGLMLDASLPQLFVPRFLLFFLLSLSSKLTESRC